MPGRLISVLLVGCTFFAHGAIPNLIVSRTGSLFFAASDLTTNGVPGLTNPVPRFLVSRVSGESTRGGRLSLIQTQAWSQRYNGIAGAQDSLQRVVVSPEGFVTAVGSSFGATYDLVTIRYTANGTALWTNRYDSPEYLQDHASWVCVDANLNAYVIGRMEPRSRIADLVILKYAPDGTALWTNRFNQFGTNYQHVLGAVLDPAGNLVLALSANYSPPERYSIAKFNPSGALVWINDYQTSGSPYDHLNALTIDATGAAIAAGTDYGTIRYSPDGVPLWTNAFVFPTTGVPSDLLVDHHGNILVTGDTWDYDVPNPPVRHYTTIKFASDGTSLWTNRLDPPGFQGGGVPRVLVDPQDHVILIGGSSTNVNYEVDLTITKLRADGLLLWTTRYFETNVTGFNSPTDAAMDAAGNTHVIYSARSAGNTNTDFLILKFSAEGVPLSTNRFDGGGYVQDYARNIALDAAGQVLVAGTTGGLSGGGDFVTVQYVDYIHYTPPPNFVGTDTFTFVATDFSGTHATNTVTVTVEAESLWFNPSLSKLRDTGEGRRLHLDGAFGTVVLYASPDLASWMPIATNAAMNGSVEFQIPPAGPHQSYRAAQSAP